MAESESIKKNKRRDDKKGGESVSAYFAMYKKQIKAHIEAHLGKVRNGFQEKWGDLSEPDILFVRASLDQPYHIFVTCGAGEKPMNVPKDTAEYSRAELVMALPQSWPLGVKSIKNEENNWPMRWLKRVGRLPQDQKTWIGQGHTISNGEYPEPIADTNFRGVLVLTPSWFPAGFSQLKTQKGEKIVFYCLIPLYQEEMDLKLQKGSEALERLLNKHNIDFVLDTARKNVVKKKGWFRS